MGKFSFKIRPLATYSAAELAREIAYVPQAHAQLFSFSGARYGVDGGDLHI